MTAGSFLLAVVGIAVLSQPLPTVLLYVAVVLAGIGTIGTQTLINVFIATRYPVNVRATAIGVALSVGRIGGIVGPLYGALLLTAGLPIPVLFLAFAAPALLGLAFAAPALLGTIVVALISRTPVSAGDRAVARPCTTV